MTLSRSKSVLSCAIVLALLHGCGGGGGGGGSDKNSGGNTSSSPSSSAPNATASVPAAPTANLGFALKQLQLSWAQVDGATLYRVLEDADGSGTFTQISGDLAELNFNRNIAVHARNWSAARYQVQACNTAGCATSATVTVADGILKAIGYFKASNTDSGDMYGWSLALSDDGDTLAIGAPGEDSNATGVNGDDKNNSSADSGAVYVFFRSSNGWQQQAYLKATSNQSGAYFGASVALSSDGKTLAIGAPFANSGAGSAYVFTRSDTTWSAQSPIAASNAYANSYFGWSVALSDDGHLLAVGSPGESNGASTINNTNHTAANAGAVYVFKFGAGTWGSQTYLKAATITTDDNFGAAIALNGSGNVVAAGAPYKANTAGAVYVFTQSGSAWSTPVAVTPSNATAGDSFGAALAFNTAGDTLAIGAPYKASNGVNAGAVYIFNSNNWSQEAKYLSAANTEADDDFGSAVALSGDGNTLAVGAIGEKSGATGINGNTADNSKDGVGAVYLFQRSNSGTWATQSTYVKPSVSTLGDEFGTAIGMKADGSTLAISGAFEQSKVSGIGGTLDEQKDVSKVDAGAVWLF